MTLLLQKYLNSVAVFDKPDDQGTVKPEIQVDSVDNRNKVHLNDPNNPDPENEDSEDGDNEEDEEDEPDPNAPENETAEQKTARIAQEKEDRRQNRIQKRIDKLTATIGNKDNEIAELRKQLAEKPKEGLSEEEVERRAAEKAAALAAAQESDRQQKAFAKTADTLLKSASKVDK